jgi:crotonobetainyl-CoA:carnitine CoA-transferase CaiB-like acyl-CoA transferase
MPRAPLEGVRVLDLATVIAGPGAARYLADYGADVLKIERPGTGDSTRGMGVPDPRDGTSLYWKLVARGKRCAVVDLKTDDGRETILRLVEDAHVVIENFRPGTLERLGLGPDELLARNPDIVILRVTGFGQDGPYAARPGFATIAEAMSGFASINGEPEGGPLLPPIALTDEVTALAGAFATMVALWSGQGQVVDVNLLESLFQCMGPLPGAFASTGYLQPRLGSGIPYSVPRGTWRCADGRWIAVSTSAESVAGRVMDLIGFGDRTDLQTFNGRIAAREEIDARMADFCSTRSQREVLDLFEEAQAAAAPIYDMADIAADPHYAARGAIVEVDGVSMQGLVARLSETPGRIRWPGRDLGADDPVWAEPTPGAPAGRPRRGDADPPRT